MLYSAHSLTGNLGRGGVLVPYLRRNRGAGADVAAWGLVSYWKLEEASGERADSYGTNHLTDHNGVGQAVGKVGDAAQFVGASNEYLSRADNASLSTGDVDFWGAAWVYLDSLPPNVFQILGKLELSAAGEWNLQLRNDTGRFHFRLFNGGGLVGNAEWTVSPTTSTWYHLCWYHDAAANQIGISMDGGAFATAATSGSPTDTAIDFTLGSFSDALFFFYDGRLDSVAFGKSPPGGIAAIIDEIRDSLYNNGDGADPV